MKVRPITCYFSQFNFLLLSISVGRKTIADVFMSSVKSKANLKFRRRCGVRSYSAMFLVPDVQCCSPRALSVCNASLQFNNKRLKNLIAIACSFFCPKFTRHTLTFDRLCGLVVRVPGYRSRGPGSIPDATRFSEKYWVWNGVHSAS
jgi:hypothetical protein